MRGRLAGTTALAGRGNRRSTGPWQLIIGDVVRKFLRYGDLHFGFACIRCPDCRHEMFVSDVIPS